jgi:hypothetical protein
LVKPDTPKQKVGRLAMREEGDNWVAYYAMPDTMEGAIFLGSISMVFVQNKDRKRAFMSFMRECVSDIMEEIFGVRPTWPDGEQPAPEHERSRNA